MFHLFGLPAIFRVNINKTMTSIQLLDMLNDNRKTLIDLKELHRSIRTMFQEEIDGGKITPSFSPNKIVAYYLIPDVGSKMLRLWIK